jgi:ribosomal protein S18 acetylase RimI-like enzyme
MLTANIPSRLYRDEQDLQHMQTLLMESRSQTNDWRYWHVGELIWDFFMVLCHLDPQGYIRLWHDPAGKLIGYAILGEDPSFHCQVSPEYVDCGIESEALAWAESQLGHLPPPAAQPWSSEFVSGVRQDDSARIAFLEAHGFQLGEYVEVNMLRSLTAPIPEVALPPGCQLRSVQESDLPDRAAIQREVWHPWTVGEVSDADYTRFRQLPGFHHDLDIVVIAPDGAIAAYVNAWIDPLNRIGDFGPVGARQAYRRQGYTRLALLEGLRRLQAYGMQRVCISTGLTNTPALNLYHSLGFQDMNRYLTYVKTGKSTPGQPRTSE